MNKDTLLSISNVLANASFGAAIVVLSGKLTITLPVVFLGLAYLFLLVSTLN